jgi:hypothetical protein
MLLTERTKIQMKRSLLIIRAIFLLFFTIAISFSEVCFSAATEIHNSIDLVAPFLPDSNTQNQNRPTAIEYYAPVFYSFAPEKRITNNPEISQHPIIINTNNGYGVFWAQYSTQGNFGLYLALLDNSGTKASEDILITDSFYSYGYAGGIYMYIFENFSAAKHPSGYGFTWKGLDNQIYFVCLDESGNQISEQVQLTSGINARISNIICHENNFYIAWNYSPSYTEIRMCLTQIDVYGNRVQPDVVIPVNYSMPYAPVIIDTGEYLALFYRGSNITGSGDAQELCFTKLDYEGNKIFADVVIEEISMYTTICPIFTGDVFGILLRTNSGMGFLLIDTNGDQIGETINPVGPQGDFPVTPSLVWSGEEFGIVWTDSRDGSHKGELYFTRLTEDAVKICQDVRISNLQTWEFHHAWYPSIVANKDGNGFSFLWQDNRHGNPNYYNGNQEVYFRKIRFAEETPS